MSPGPQPRQRFAGRTVVVTGASRGLGRAIALAFAAEAAHVCVGFRTREAEAADTARAVEAAGGTASLFGVDVRDRAAVDAAFQRLRHERGAADVLVNNAGIARDALAPMMSADDWNDVLATNLGGVFHACRAAAAGMMAAGAGTIVNVASVAGVHASPGQANYSAAKGGVIALTRTLAAELAPRGVRVNAVVPGLLTTGMAAKLDRRIVDRARERIPAARLGDGAEVAAAVLFLASADASYVYGQALVVDGGLTL